MNVPAHVIEILPDPFPDDSEDIFHIFLLIRSDVIALAVIEGDGRAFGAVGMNAGCPGSSLVPDLRSVNVAELKDVPDQSTLADARRAALILPAEEEADTEKVCGILMPIMIQ